jgi:hypothetical protein
MMIPKKTKTFFVSSLIIGVFFLSACETGLKKDMEPSMMDVKSISVFPFVCMDCPILANDGKTPGISENASSVMTEYLVDKLRKKDGVDVALMPPLDKEGVQDLYSGMIKLSKEGLKETVCVGRIYSFKERKGGNYSVSEPARVSFDMRIIRVSDGKVLFFCDYDETQRPLLNNILNIGTFHKRKGRWVKADEMALNAIDEALEDYFDKNP